MLVLSVIMVVAISVLPKFLTGDPEAGGLWPRDPLLMLLALVLGIAAQLHLAPGTVRNYVSAAIDKTGAANRVEAYSIAFERGWL